MSGKDIASCTLEDEIAYLREGCGDAAFFFTCEHAGREVPPAFDDLGLGRTAFASHEACDSGAAALCLALARLTRSPALLGRFSRLVADLNRDPAREDAVPACVDALAIPANRALTAAQREARLARYHAPYHARLAHLLALRPDAVLLPIHSFTPSRSGVSRPWQIALMWADDHSFTGRVAQWIGHGNDWLVGLNQPYSAHNRNSHTLVRHGLAQDRPALMIEVRQDLLETGPDVERMASVIASAMEKARKP